MKENNLSGLASVTGALAGGIAASACCVLPMVFLWLGVSGAWIANLTALAAYHSVFIGLSVVLLLASYHFIYRRQNIECKVGERCEKTLPPVLVRISFWAAVSLVGVAAIFPYVVTYFYGG